MVLNPLIDIRDLSFAVVLLTRWGCGIECFGLLAIEKLGQR